jgi:hypothetical protein
MGLVDKSDAPYYDALGHSRHRNGGRKSPEDEESKLEAHHIRPRVVQGGRRCCRKNRHKDCYEPEYIETRPIQYYWGLPLSAAIGQTCRTAGTIVRRIASFGLFIPLENSTDKAEALKNRPAASKMGTK